MGRKKQFDRREAIEAAKALFWRQGYDGTSIRDLSEVLNMHSGSIYQAFGSKERLFAEVLEEYGRQHETLLMQCLIEHEDVLAGYGAFLRRVALTTQDCKTCMVAKAAGAITLPQALRTKAQAMLLSVEQTLIDMLETQKKAGKVKADLESPAIARLMQSQIVGIRTIADSGMATQDIQRTIDLQLQSLAALINIYDS